MDNSLTELTEKGKQIYLTELKDKLEKTHMDETMVLDVDSKKYFVNPDPKIAVEKAQKAFPDKLFFIVKIGTFREPPANLKKSDSYAWVL